MADIEEILALDRVAFDRFRSGPVPSVLPRTFGGQVAAQALMATARTVDPAYQVHSLHGYFLRPGRPHEPMDHLVDRIRDGGSFHIRQVTATQSGEAVFSMTASFHRGDEGFSHQTPMPSAPTPDAIAESDRISGRSIPRLAEWQDWDTRTVPRVEVEDVPGTPACQRMWIRHRRTLPDDPVLHSCALTYLSDMSLLGSARIPHPRRPLQGASLDHSLWFLRPFRADEWLLYDQVSLSAETGRALNRGRLYDGEGRLVAAVAQEGLLRFDHRADPGGDTRERANGEHTSGRLPTV
jgi:acyl-CoA thioesterase II